MIFHDRRDAGRALARRLRDQPWMGDAVVLALPRGGVPVAFEVASALRRPLDVCVVRKLGVPGQEELAMGAVASGGLVVRNESVLRIFGISPAAFDAVLAQEMVELERREAAWRSGRPPLAFAERPVLLIDDGLATGSTMTAAARALRPLARRVVAAVPVTAASACDLVRREVDEFFSLETPQRFEAVGEFYRGFDPVSDEEVRALLAQSQTGGNAPRAA